MPPITLYFLQASRCIRTAWLLEELGLDYDLQFADRTAASKAPDEFKAASGNPLGKFPTLRDGKLVVYESGAITECVITLSVCSLVCGRVCVCDSVC
jgi:glutathione S-transferase